MIDDMVRTWAPDELWQVAEPLIPAGVSRRQGGARRRTDDRAVLAAIVYLVQAGCSWWKLPAAMFGVSRATAHRRRKVARQGILVRIARKGVDSSKRLGRHRWIIESCLSWLMKYRRLVRRYERKAEHFQASPTWPAHSSATDA